MDKIEQARKEYEAAGTVLHGWGESDYRMEDKYINPQYVWLEQRRAFALWLYAKGISQ